MMDCGAANNACRCLVLFCVTLVIAVSAGCGGNGGDAVVQPVIKPADQDRTVSAGFELGDSTECTAGLVLSCRDLGSGVLVEVSAAQSLDLDSLIVEVCYDSSGYSVAAAQTTGEFASLDRSLCLEVLQEPGSAWLAQVPLGGGSRHIEPDRVLASVLFTRRSETAAVKVPASVPVNSAALCPLLYSSAEELLRLYYVNPGDYDQNGLVSASDLVPLGRDFNLSGPFDFSSAHSVVDGNGNGQIEVADLSVIGQNWGHEVSAFNFYGSNEVGDVPNGYADPSTIQPLGYLELSAALGQPVSDRLTFEYSIAGNPAFSRYWARPYDGKTGSEGTCSNLAGPGLVSQLGSAANALPVAQLAIEYPEPAVVPLTAELDASGSSDFDGVIARYEWDYEGDGLYDGFGDSPVVGHTYTAAGEYAPIVRVTDNLGAWAIAQVEAFTVTAPDTPNLDPVADLIATIQTGTVPLAVGFLASGSSDPDGYIASYRWDFDGDGVTDLDSGTDPTVIHLYEVAGTYQAGLTVVDDRGGTASDMVLIEVAAQLPANEPPVAMITADVLYGDEPLTVNFDATGSLDPDGSITKYEWDFDGDGNFEEYGTNPQRPFHFTDNGLYPALVRVTDDRGESTTASVDIRVNEVFDHPAPWPMFGHDQHHTFRSQYTGPQEPEVRWEYNMEIGTNVKQLPIAGPDGMFYVVNNYMELLALDSDGDVQWRYKDGNSVRSAAVAGGYGIACGTGTELVLLDWDGSVIWRYDAGNWIYSINYNPQTDSLDILVYISDASDYFIRVGMDGTEAWRCEGVSLFAGVVAPIRYQYLSNGSCVISKGRLYVISDSGSVEFSDSCQGIYPVVVSDDSIVYVNGDSVHAITSSGAVKWSYNIGTYGSNGNLLGVDQDDTVFVADGEGTLYALNPDGTLKWDYTVTGSRWWPGLVAGNVLYVINADENYDRSLYAFNSDGTVKWQREDIFSWDLFLLSNGSILTSDVNDNLVSITTDGDLNWEVYIGNPLYYDPIELTDGTIVGCNVQDVYPSQLFIVNQDGTLKFTYTGIYLVNASPAAVGNSSIYVGSTNYTMFSVTEAGLTDWKQVTWSAWTWAPTIADTGDVSYANTDNILQSFDSTGHLKWTVPGVNFGFALPIYHAGSLYVGASYGVASYGSDGSTNWTCDVGEILTSPTMGPDGILYAASETGLYCISGDGTELWKCELPAVSLGFYNGDVYSIAFPSVDTGGTVYNSRRADGLFAVDPDGNVKWNYQVDGDIETTPAITASGNIIIGCNNSEVHSISPDGFTNWVYNCDGDVNPAMAVDAQDTAYVICQGDSVSELLAIDAAGNLKWSFDLPSISRAVPVLGDGVLYLQCIDGKLYAIGDPSGP